MKNEPKFLTTLISFGRKISRNDSITGNAVKIYLLQFAGLGISMFSSVVIARSLGPAGKGVVDLFSVLQSFIVEIGLFGFGSGLLYHLANKGRPLSVIHGTGLVGAIVLGLIATGIGYAAIPKFQILLEGLPAWMILLAFSLAPISFYLVIWNNLQNGINKPVLIQKVTLFVGAANLAGVLILFLSDRLTPGRMVVQLSVLSVLNALACFGALIRKEPKVRFELALASESFKRGLLIYFGFVANILHFRVDQIMVNSICGTREVGLYSLSVKFAEMLFLLDTALISSALHKISSAGRTESHALTGRIFRKQLLISGGSGLGLVCIAYPMIRVLYGVAFLESVLPLILLVPGILAWSVAKVLSQYITFNLGRFGLVTAIAILGLALNIVLNWILLPRLGISGAAVASSFSYGAMLLFTFFTYRRLA